MALDGEQIKGFVDAIEKQRHWYSQLKDMAEMQIELLEKNNTEGIHFLIAKKQEALDAVDKIEQKVKPIKENWDVVRTHFDPKDLETAENALLYLRETLKELIDLEDQWKQLVETKHENTRGKLTRLEKGRRMNNAYGVNDPSDPRYMDKKE